MWKRALEASDVKEIGGRVRVEDDAVVRVEDDVVVRVEDGKGSGQDSVGKIRFRIR